MGCGEKERLQCQAYIGEKTKHPALYSCLLLDQSYPFNLVESTGSLLAIAEESWAPTLAEYAGCLREGRKQKTIL